ncbi:MAG: pantetheine-phosphate adenylyltransferase [Oscillospiraceae bacterium]|jgi:pantetheine-phosphate adenylyltransferase|nr:pantetheine-phosphate adenylyltransferase [Oscillospiraceae bacterium]
MSIAVYPGSFDPITLGHLNIIRRAASLFDKLYVCVMINSDKNPLFNREERVDFIQRAVIRYKNVVVDSSEELLVKYMQHKNAKVIIKGLRAVSDFDKEFQIALINRKLDSKIETLFIPSSEKYTYISSSAVKEMARYGDDLKTFVPHEIIDDVIRKVESEGMMFR